MTAFEQYVHVSTHIKESWGLCPVFIRGEVIKISTPYLVLDSLDLTIEGGLSCDENVQATNIFCYEENRGKLKKLTSDLKDFYRNTSTDKVNLEDVHIDPTILPLENKIFEGIVSFKTRSKQ